MGAFWEIFSRGAPHRTGTTPLGSDVCFYTALYGDRDIRLNPGWAELGVPLVYFSDREMAAPANATWRRCPALYPDSNRSAKFFKLMPHLCIADFQSSVWFDANIVPKIDHVRQWIEKREVFAKFALFGHPERSCVFEEGKTCAELGRDDSQVIERQMEHYREQGVKPGTGLYAGGFLFRRHLDAMVMRMNCEWWSEVGQFSKRDQLSLPVILQRTGIQPQVIPGSYWNNELFVYGPHSGQ